MEKLTALLLDSGIANLTLGQTSMIIVGLVLLYLAIAKKFEPLLLVTIGMGTILVNIPGAGMGEAPIYDAAGNLEKAGGLL
ncbi:MAG: sodium ion-translocating decarboxylase subunit beta, partial [Pseudomonadota bacterium]